MMLCEWKGFLWVCAGVIGGAILVAVGLWVRLLFRAPVSDAFEIAMLTVLFLSILGFLLAAVLISEHSQAVRERTGDMPRQNTSSFTREEMTSWTKHCPRPLKIAAVALAALCALQLIGIVGIGTVEVIIEPGLSKTEMRIVLSGVIVFLSLVFPVVVSAARMEGGYEDQLQL